MGFNSGQTLHQQVVCRKRRFWHTLYSSHAGWCVAQCQGGLCEPSSSDTSKSNYQSGFTIGIKPDHDLFYRKWHNFQYSTSFNALHLRLKAKALSNEAQALIYCHVFGTLYIYATQRRNHSTEYKMILKSYCKINYSTFVVRAPQSQMNVELKPCHFETFLGSLSDVGLWIFHLPLMPIVFLLWNSN